MCWPSQPQSSPPSRRMTVALRRTPSVLETASMISGGVEEPNSESRKAAVAVFELVPAAKRFRAARQRIRPLRRVVVAPRRRNAWIFGIARLGAVEPVDRAERIVPGDGEANLRGFSRRDADATGERAVLGLLPHLGRRARRFVASLRHWAWLREFAPIAAEAVEPLAAHVIVDVLDAVAFGRDREIAALPFRPVDIGRAEVQRAQAVRLAKTRARRCRSRSFRACRRSCSRSRRRCRSRSRRR